MQHPEENFDGLRRALKLKRHEQPPPGYFNNLPAQIISRIRENDAHDRAGALDAAVWEAPWLNRILDFLQARPTYAGVLGAAACALLIAGLVYSERPAGLAVNDGPRLGDLQNIPGVGSLNNASDTSLAGSSASPIGALPPGTTLFDKMRPFQSAPAFSSTNLLQK